MEGFKRKKKNGKKKTISTDLQAVFLHRPPQWVHNLPANEDAQVNEEHPAHDDQQLLVLDDLQGAEREE